MSLAFLAPSVIRHPHGPLRPTLEMRLRRRVLRSRRVVLATLSTYGMMSLGLLGILVRLSAG